MTNKQKEKLNQKCDKPNMALGQIVGKTKNWSMGFDYELQAIPL